MSIKWRTIVGADNGILIQAAASNARVVNNGVISGTGGSGEVVLIQANNPLIINQGEITGNLSGINAQGVAGNVEIRNEFGATVEGSERGILINSDNTTITNNGTIIGLTNDGIQLFASDGIHSEIINNGAIIGNDDGVHFAIDNAVLVNNGTIVGLGSDNGDGVFINTADNISVYNNESISGSVDGVQTLSNDTVLVNQGVITGGRNGFRSGGTSTNPVVINRGTIKVTNPSSETSYAILFDDTVTNPSLVLYRGSNIQGRVDNKEPMNIEVEKGLNLHLTSEDSADAGFGVLNVGEPYITVGNTHTLVAVDPTSFAMQSDILEDLSDAIFNSIQSPQNGCSNLFFSKSIAKRAYGLNIFGVGSWRKRVRSNIKTNNDQGGLVVGFNVDARSYIPKVSSREQAKSPGTMSRSRGNRPTKRSKKTPMVWCGGDDSFYFTIMPYAGATWGRGRVESQTATADFQSYFGGVLYEQFWLKTFWGASLASGYFGSDNQRNIMYNLAPGGQETAKAKAKGAMLTTEVYASKSIFSISNFSPILNAGVRYAGLYLGNYSETGSSSNLQVKNRNISLIKPQLDLALSQTFVSPTKRAIYNIQPYVGIAGRFQVGGNYFNAVILGQSFDFQTGSSKSLAELLYGISGSFSMNLLSNKSRPQKTKFDEVFGNVSFTFNVQGLHDSANSDRLMIDAGASYQF